MLELCDTDVAWLAGIIEGEGCIRTYVDKRWKNPRPQLRVYLGMTDKDVIEGVVKMISYKNKIYEQLKPKDKKHWSQCYKIEIHGYLAQEIIELFYPYMFSRRKQKINEVLAMDLAHHPKRKDD